MTTELTHCPACGHELEIIQQWLMMRQRWQPLVTCKNPDCKHVGFTLTPESLIKKCQEESK